MAAATGLPVRTTTKSTGAVDAVVSRTRGSESQAAIPELLKNLDFLAEAQ